MIANVQSGVFVRSHITVQDGNHSDISCDKKSFSTEKDIWCIENTYTYMYMFNYCKLLLWTINIDNSVFLDTKDCDIKRKQFPYYTGQHVNIHKIKMWWSKECALLRFHSFTARKHWNIVNTPDKYKEYKILTTHHRSYWHCVSWQPQWYIIQKPVQNLTEARRHWA